MSNFDSCSLYNRGRRTNFKQKHILISAMATNRKLLEGRACNPFTRKAREAAWNSLAFELNAAGPEKHISEWKKVWTDLRLQLRKKWEKAQQSQYMLTEFERRVIDACGMIENPGDEETNPKSAAEINSFLIFLKEEHTKEYGSKQQQSEYLKEENSNSLTDLSDFMFCQSEQMNIKEEFEAEPTDFIEHKIPPVVCVSDDELSTEFEQKQEPVIECISDDEEEIAVTNIEKPDFPSPSYNKEPIWEDSVPRPILLEREDIPPIKPEQSKRPHLSSKLLKKLKNIKLSKKKTLKDGTLKEIKKMHRNLLKQSKKQTALLRKLVRLMQR